MTVFVAQSDLDATPAEVFAYHAAPRAFQRLTPPWEDVEVAQPLARLADGERAVMRVPIGPLKVRWVARHEHVRDGADGGTAGFDDVMEEGPATSWRHEHRFEPLAGGRCRLVDRITWTAPPGGALVVGPKLDRLFHYRHATTRDDLRLRRELGDPARTRIGVTGATGLIGRELCALLSVLGHDVVPFRRVAAASAVGGAVDADGVTWHPASGTIDVAAADGLDVVIHLAGENIGLGRLTTEKLERLRTQRVDQTRALLGALATDNSSWRAPWLPSVPEPTDVAVKAVKPRMPTRAPGFRGVPPPRSGELMQGGAARQ